MTSTTYVTPTSHKTVATGNLQTKFIFFMYMKNFVINYDVKKQN